MFKGYSKSISFNYEYRPPKVVALLISFTIFVVFSVIYGYVLNTASNDRDWEVGFESLPSIKVIDNQITVKNLRDFKYQPDKVIAWDYTEQTVDINKLKQVWFIVEPFSKWEGVAHTYFVFDFEDQDDPIAVSIEARREKGENYNVVLGGLNNYELIYIWGKESDLTLRRALIDKQKLYMYPLTFKTDTGAERLFMQLIQSTQQLEDHPRFYNTLTSNCTNELAKAANNIQPGTIPLDIAYLLPGYSDELLYRLGYIPNDQPLEEVSKKYYLNDYINNLSSYENFSTKLREYLSPKR